jgi:hypothetical protein
MLMAIRINVPTTVAKHLNILICYSKRPNGWVS